MESRLNRHREPLPTHVHDLPPLPPAYGRALDAGLEVMAWSLSAEARAAIDGHVRLLLAWTAAINLTAIREPEAVARLHVLDSLSAAAPIAGRRDAGILDLGSGGGFPGLPLAAALGCEALLVESVAKKARFLETVAVATGLAGRVTVAATRAETLAADGRQRGRWPVVTARAVAPLADLVELAFPLLAPGGWLVAWKRGDIAAELAAGRRAIAALGGGDLRVRPVDLPGLEGHRLVFAERSGQVPDGFPRDPALRARQPL